jgi:phosphoribosylglycinamide formyltransferase-1
MFENNQIMKKTVIAIFASGTGSNAQKIIDHFKNNDCVKIGLIVCNNPQAQVLNIAEREEIPILLIEKKRFQKEDAYLSQLKIAETDYLILAGFLWKISQKLIAAFPKKIINIHPALLPKFGGKGMYGHFVHEAVIAAGEKESGVTIHFVDEQYDHGDIIFQIKCNIATDDTPVSLAQKIQTLEHKYFPKVIEEVIQRGED